MLRKFLFLDDSSVRDYLSVLEGYVTGEEVGRTETGQTEISASIGVHWGGAKAGKGKEAQDQSRLIITAPARFERLYKLLEEDHRIQHLDAFDQGIWDQIENGEMLEILVDSQFPELYTTLLALSEVTKTVGDVLPLLEIFDTLSPLFAEEGEARPVIDSQTREQLTGLGAISGVTTDLTSKATDIPVIFKAVSMPNFQFYARLPKQHVRVDDLRDLEGQAYVFGKVFRKVPKGQDLEVFSLVPGLTNVTSPLNRHQRRAMKKASSGTTEDLSNRITGPIIVLDPVAIYR